MALRSPVNAHNFWGEYSTTALLPGVPSTEGNLQTGDTAYVAATSLLYVCTDNTPGSVVWTEVAGITEITGDVTTTAGPGSVTATVEKIQGYEVATAAPANGNVLAWSTAQNKWVPGSPAVGGGSGGVVLYLNGSTAATAPTTSIPVPSNVPGTIVQELGTTGQVAAANVESNNLTQVPGAYDLVANFVTPPTSPGVTSIPAGLWEFNIWASSSGTANQTVMQVRVYKYDGAAVPTLIATSDDVSIYDPTVIAQYTLTVVIPAGVTLLATDRVYVELRARATNNNRRITFRFGDGEPTHVTTTLPSAAGGDLSGTYPDPTVVAIQGNAISANAPADGEVLTWDNAASEWVPAASTGGAVYAGALTVYVDPVNGTDAPGGGTLAVPYATIQYAYNQVPSLGDVLNVSYNADVGQFITEKLVIQLAPGRYVENVVLGFKRARVQLVGGGVQIVGNVTLSAVRADFPAANMQALRASFPTPWTGAGALVTFEITGGGLAGLSGIESGGVEADATSDTLLVTGITTLLFNEPTLPGSGLGTNWDANYGQFNFYANRANLIGGQVITTAYTVPITNALPTCVIEIEGCTIGESSNPVRSYLGAVPYAYFLASSPTTNWAKGTGVATGAGQLTTALVDTTKTWTVNEYAGATLRLTSGTGSGQTATVISNTATTLTFAALATAPVANSTVYSLVGITNKTPVGVITLKTHNSTIGASVGPRIVLGELDGCRVYDIDRTMLGTVDNGAVNGTTSTSYIGLVINQFRIYSGTGIPASQYQLGASSGTTRYKLDSTSYTTLAFNRSGAGVLTARTLNFGGGVSFDFQDDSRSLAYTPTTGANWVAPAPTTVQSALDRIASAVFVLRGSSAIP